MTDNDDEADTYPDGLRSYLPFGLKPPTPEPEVSLGGRLASTWFAPMYLSGAVAVVGLMIGYFCSALGIILVFAGVSGAFIHWALVRARQFLGLSDNPEGKGLATCDAVQKMDYESLIGLRRASWPASVVGLCEAVMYPLAMQLGVPEFVLGWIGLKVVSQWVWWKDDETQSNLRGRTRFQVFLLGNFFSIMVGLVTFLVLRQRLGPCWLEPLPRVK